MQIALIHSPLVGPLTWQPVAEILRAEGINAVVPVLSQTVESPYWKSHADTIAGAIGTGQTPILIGHSGAGVLLPAVRQRLDRPVGGYIFVDANIPVNGKSRLDLFSPPESVEAFRQSAVGGLLPTWTADDLVDVIPDDQLRQQFVDELRQLPLAVYEEPIPVFAGWPDAPCSYLHFSATYDDSADYSHRMGWTYRKMDGLHFHMLVDPQAVTYTLLEIIRAMP
jgi:hypothetical protein